MKTNRFDEILRRKLESIQPDFQEQDWDKWQAFRQHATPTFWQTYGHWLGYAVATVTTAVMVVLYVSQSNQNKDLLKEMQELRQQVSARNNTGQAASDSASSDRTYPSGGPSAGTTVSPPDTVYVVERRTVYVERPPRVLSNQNSANIQDFPDPGSGETPGLSKNEDAGNDGQAQKYSNPTQGTALPTTEEVARTDAPASAKQENLDINPQAPLPPSAGQRAEQKTGISALSSRGTLPASGTEYETQNPIVAARSYDSERLDLREIMALPTPAYTKPATGAYRHLQSRMPRLAGTSSPGQRVVVAQSSAAPVQKTEVPASGQKAEKIAREERLLPDFGLGLPFRIGVGQQWEGRTKASGLWNEVLIGQHWSVQAGLSFQKLEAQKFYNDRIFREKTHEDFRKEHAKPLPQSFDIFNITIGTTLTQIPLNLTYRGDLGHGFAYFAGVGTRLSLRARQTLSFDYKLPTNDFGEYRAERRVPFPFVNNLNAMVGVEKRFSPIVLQGSLLVDNRFRAFPGFNGRSGLGVQVKLLYEMNVAKKR